MSLPGEKEVWLTVDTPGFVFYGNGNATQLQEVAASLESLRRVLERLTGASPAEVPRIPVVAFSTRRQFDIYREGAGIPNARVVGVFVHRAGRRMIALAMGERTSSYATVYHEYLHHVVGAKLGRTPVWFNEGIAGVYESFRCDGNVAEIGRAPQHHLNWLNTRPWIPLADLLGALGSEELHAQTGERQTAFYAEAWLLVHNLFFGHPERRPQLAAFLDAYRRGEPPAAAFEKYFEGGIAGVDAEVRHYLYGTLPFVSLEGVALEPSEIAEAQLLGRVELLNILGELLLSAPSGNLDLAESHFRAARAAAPDDLRAQAGLGAVAALSDHWEEAAALIDPAIDAGIDDPAALRLGVQFALTRADSARERGHGAAGESVERLRAQWLAERVLRTDPFNPDTLALVGSTYFHNPGDVARGIAVLESARQLDPNQGDALRGLALLYSRQRNRVRAEEICTRLERSTAEIDLELVRQVRTDLDLLDSDDAVDAREFDRAQALLVSARECTDDESLRAKIDERRRVIDAARRKPIPPAPRRRRPAASTKR